MNNLKHILLFASMALILGCNTQYPNKTENLSTLSKIKQIKELNVGYVNYPPIVYKDVKTGEVTGHFVLTLKEIFNQVDVKLNFIETTWSTFSAGLQNGQFDLSIAPTFSTIPRAYTVAFTNPLMYVGNSALCTLNDNRFKTLADLDKKGITIAVTQGEQGDEYAKDYIKNATVKVLSQADQNLAFTQVMSGRADVALGDAFAISQFAKEHKGEVKDIFKDNPYNLTGVSWAVRYNDLEFLHFLNVSIDVMSSTGKLIESEKHFDANWLHKKQIWTID